MVDTKKNNSSITRKNLVNAYKTLRKAESKMDYCAIIGSIYLIVIRLRPSIIGYLYKFFSIGMGVCGLRINKILSFLEIISVISICLCIILRVGSFVEKVLWDFHLEKIKGNNRFEQSALRYMREKGVPHCFLVSGDWGSGKTYDVNDFLEKYYYLSGVNTYRVSCFGLRTRNEVIEEINNTIERSDTSLIGTIIVFISDVPLLGEPLNKLIGRTYSYEKVKKGSVFVFDDFERITSRTPTEAQPPDLYKKDVFFKHHLSKIDSGDRGIIDEEFEKIESAFKFLRKEQAYITDRTDYDKYISVAGLINELIETYKMKVFIICNTDVVGEKFIHDVLRSKLNCIEFRKHASSKIRESVITSLIRNTVFEDSQKQKIVTDFERTISRKMNGTEVELAFSNLRLYSSLFEALINEVMLIDSAYLTKDFLESLFQSISLTHILYYNNDLSMLKSFKNGMNIAFQLRLYDNKRRYVGLAEDSYDYRWVDIALSGHWILNLPKPIYTNWILNQWEEYEYSELEKNLNIDYSHIEETDKYDLIHVLFVHRVYGEAVNWDYKTAINNSLNEYDLTRIDTIQDILDIAQRLLSNPIGGDFYDELFRALQKGNAKGEIMGDEYLHQRYKTFIKKENNRTAE